MKSINLVENIITTNFGNYHIELSKSRYFDKCQCTGWRIGKRCYHIELERWRHRLTFDKHFLMRKLKRIFT